MYIYTMFSKVKKYDFDYKLPSFCNGDTAAPYSIDDLKRISPFFTEVSPFTYAVLLEANKNRYTEEEKEKTRQLIHYLTQKENETMKAVSAHLKTREEYERAMNVIEQKLDEVQSVKESETP